MIRFVYLDSDFKCHAANDGTLTAAETNLFDGKCDAFIEGYRFVPAGMSWVREDGEVFHGEMASPWKNYDELEEAQREYEQELLAEYEILVDELYLEASS